VLPQNRHRRPHLAAPAPPCSSSRKTTTSPRGPPVGSTGEGSCKARRQGVPGGELRGRHWGREALLARGGESCPPPVHLGPSSRPQSTRSPWRTTRPTPLHPEVGEGGSQPLSSRTSYPLLPLPPCPWMGPPTYCRQGGAVGRELGTSATRRSLSLHRSPR
jgi:hypothetical protein